jgi:hypothetical protein
MSNSFSLYSVSNSVEYRKGHIKRDSPVLEYDECTQGARVPVQSRSEVRPFLLFVRRLSRPPQLQPRLINCLEVTFVQFLGHSRHIVVARLQHVSQHCILALLHGRIVPERCRMCNKSCAFLAIYETVSGPSLIDENVWRMIVKPVMVN